MSKSIYYQGRRTPLPGTVTKVRGGSELKPPDPQRCWHHSWPVRDECPSCISNYESARDHEAMKDA